MSTTTISTNENEKTYQETTPNNQETTPNNISLPKINTQINIVTSNNDEKMTLIDHIFFVPAFIIIFSVIFITIALKSCVCMLFNIIKTCCSKLMSWIYNLFY